MRTHKEQMEYLKKYDPITYYEMGGVGDNGSTGVIIFIGVVVILAVSIVSLFLLT